MNQNNHHASQTHYHQLSTTEDDTAPSKRPRSQQCVLVTLAILLGFILLLALSSYIWVRRQVVRFTVPSRHYPHPPLPVASLDDTRLSQLQEQIRRFWTTADSNDASLLVLTEDDLNLLLASDDFYAHVRLVEQNHLQLEYAVPTDRLPGGRGRYFMGHVEVDMASSSSHAIAKDDSSPFNSIMDVQVIPEQPIRGVDFDTLAQWHLHFDNDNDKMTMTIESGQVLNTVWTAADLNSHLRWDCPQEYHHQDDYDDCLQVASALAQLESVSIQDGKLILQRSVHEGRQLVAEAPTPSFRSVLVRRLWRAASQQVVFSS